ncbi:hypothetical protein P170DRAFT_370420 [Aspergillus steynii IBT 23096]|uniref:Integral membrane protein n=1 Tax=Aspergillus steynii IBT 23096 TaxID=1392250 RepID=A0A2I2FRI8_9EURO|nr:uncharacterized protein P170DRAFT_370420 [Aspergillus steynii IBT 23096]PLB43227.1 hypothetical protein P170DRAFT_370420 [Aspergillus steynii IBT 23096]
MDRIEPVEGSQDPEGQQPPSSNLSRQPSSQPTRPRALSSRTRRPTIRLQRLPSYTADQVPTQPQRGSDTPGTNENRTSANLNASSSNLVSPTASQPADDSWQANRRRSSSEPHRGRWSTAATPNSLPRLANGQALSRVDESNLSPLGATATNPTFPPEDPRAIPNAPVQRRGSRNLLRWTSEAALNRFSRNRVTEDGTHPDTPEDETEYHPHIVDVLDVIDPQVSALSTLTNVQNSLFVPNLGPLLNRNQTYTLSPPRESSEEEETTTTDEGEEPTDEKDHPQRPPLERPLTSLSAVLEKQDTRFAVLPEGSNLEGWTQRDVEELNDHVRHMLHSRRSKFKRSMKGFGKYVSKPLGFLITLYATLITLFGLAWVLFLIGWINVGGRQLYIINVIDNVLVALFAIMGDGLAPFRAIDTYHMIFIAHYTFLTWKIRRKRRLPELKDKNDLPARREIEVDVEFGDTPKDEEHEFSVLNRLQQQKLMHHQKKLSRSHTFYKPHETLTHHAFPLRVLIAIVVLLDCHSLLQISLGACTWGISYHVRPFALTTVILCCSIACNISGGVLIMIGDRRSRKRDVVERLFREKLTSEAMKKINKKKRKVEKQITEETGEDPPRVSTASARPQPYEGT